MSRSDNWREGSWRGEPWQAVDVIPSTKIDRDRRNLPRKKEEGLAASHNWASWARTEPYRKPSTDHPTPASRWKGNAHGSSQQKSWRTGCLESDPHEHRRPEGMDAGPGFRPNDRLPHLRASEKEEGSGTGVQAVYEGRRVYLGSLPYNMKPTEIENFITDHDCMDGFVSMHISVDPFTGKHPGYCFIEYDDIDAAEKTMDRMNGLMLQGRQVKCKPCTPKGQTLAGRRGNSHESAFNRWGEWSSTSTATNGEDVGPNQALARFRNTAFFEDRRLFVGNLPRMHDQAMNHAEMMSIFDDFNIEAISKRYGLYEESKDNKSKTRQNYCHVDFATPEDAAEAKRTMHGQMFRGAALVVDWARQDGQRRGAQ